MVSLKKYTKRSLLFAGACLLFIALSFVSYAAYDFFFQHTTPTGNSLADKQDYSCSVLGINLHGTLLTYIPESNNDDMLSDKDVTSSESIVGAINSAKDDDRIKGVLIEIDSAGGLPVAGEEIANALKSLGKPSAAVIRQTGTSAAYWAATGADKIFASKNSDVGSIGVTMSYTENISTSSKYIQLSTGKYKDAGDPNKPLTQDERNMFMHDLEIVHKNFVKDVSQNRGLQEDKVKAIADGSSILGEKALELKLIDGIGSWTQAEDYLKEKIGEKPEICWQ